MHRRRLGPEGTSHDGQDLTGQHEPYDVTQEGFPYGAVRDVLIDGVPCTMFRISFVGENGWEVYTNVEHGLRVWDSIARPARSSTSARSASGCTR